MPDKNVDHPAHYGGAIRPHPNARNQIAWTPDMIAAIPALRQQGLRFDQIAEKIGVTTRTLRLFRRATGLRLNPIKRARPTTVGAYRKAKGHDNGR